MMPHNLPLQPTSFVGRASELAEIATLLADSACRLLTLVGPGGVGKTRLALESARLIIEGQAIFPNGVYFVPCQPLNSPDFIISTIAEAVNFPFYPGGEPEQQLMDYLHQKKLLLLLDNFEHLLDGVGLVSQMLAHAPGVQVLATSRERLSLVEEWVFEVQGLAVPPDETIAEIGDYSAVQLFVQNARRVQRGFALTEGQKPPVIRICQMVGGMPLGIELASAWVRALSCEQIADEIARSLDILESPARNVPQRHRNMRTVLEHSWRRLSEDEQDAFKKLSVFRGGCSRKAAEAVANASLGVLSGLVDKSMLRVTPTGRYEVHELLRQYGEEQLSRSAVASQQVHDQHCAYYTEALRQRETDLKGERQLEALDDIQSDFENVRAAWNWALAQKNADAIDRSLHSLYLFCTTRSRFQEGWALFWQAEQQFGPEATDEPLLIWGRIRARRVCLQAQGYLDRPGDVQAEIEGSLALARKYDNPADIAFCLWTMGEAAFTARDYAEAIPRFQASLADYRALNDRFYIARTLQRIGLSHGNMGQLDKFARFAQEGFQLAREIGDKIGMANCLYNLGSAAGFVGDNDKCERHYQEALKLRREIGDQASIAVNLAGLGLQAFFRGDIETASDRAEESLKIASDLHHIDGRGIALSVLSLVASLEGDYLSGRRLGDEGRAIAVNPLRFMIAEWGLSIAACGLGDYGAAGQYACAALKYALGFHTPYDIKVILPVSAMIAAHDGDLEGAIELLALVSTSPANSMGWMEKWTLLASQRVQWEAELSPEVYAAAWERGLALDAEAVAVRLIGDLPPSPELSLPAAMLQANQSLVEPLSERELEVLQLIAAGLSNPEIAERLFVGVSTVKKHINHVYGKLGVETRSEALARAQDLQLL